MFLCVFVVYIIKYEKYNKLYKKKIKITNRLFLNLQIFGHAAFIKQKVR